MILIWLRDHLNTDLLYIFIITYKVFLLTRSTRVDISKNTCIKYALDWLNNCTLIWFSKAGISSIECFDANIFSKSLHLPLETIKSPILKQGYYSGFSHQTLPCAALDKLHALWRAVLLHSEVHIFYKLHLFRLFIISPLSNPSIFIVFELRNDYVIDLKD